MNKEIYNKVANVPQNAQKQIGAGRLKGMTDINPMWRIDMLTELFGAAGVGWYTEITKQWLEPGADGVICAFCNINLYIKVDGEWSKPITGTGGSSFVAKEKNGLYTSDECVDGDCEVLTKKGWVKFKNYNGTDEIAQFDKDTDEIKFVEPINFIKKRSINTYKKGSIIMTHGHRNLYETSKGVRCVDIAENLSGYEGRAYFDLHSGFYGERKKLTTMQKIGIMLCCDGTKHRVTKDGNIIWNLAFAKKRKIDRAKKLLKEANIDILYEHTSKRENPNWNDYTQIRFMLDGTDYKKYSNFIDYGNYTDLAGELVFWDGAYSEYVKNGNVSFFSVNKDNIIYLQTLFALSGIFSTIYFKSEKKAYTLYAHKSKRSKIEKIEKYGKECDVFCVEVPSTFFFIKKDDEILITGNCHKMAYTDALSVACKALGFGANVYWSQGRTKYNNQQPQQENKDTQEIMRLIGDTNTDLQKVLDAYKVKSLQDMTAAQIENLKKTLRGRLK